MKIWLLLTIPVCIVAPVLLVRVIRSLTRVVRAAVIARVPIRAEQELTFERDGTVGMDLEGPLFTALPPLEYTLFSSATRQAVRAGSTYTKNVSSFSRARVGVCSFELPAAGNYFLRIDKMIPGKDYGSLALVFTRPFGFTLVVHVIAILILGFASIGALVASMLIVTGKLTPAS